MKNKTMNVIILVIGILLLNMVSATTYINENNITSGVIAGTSIVTNTVYTNIQSITGTYNYLLANRLFLQFNNLSTNQNYYDDLLSSRLGYSYKYIADFSTSNHEFNNSITYPALPNISYSNNKLCIQSTKTFSNTTVSDRNSYMRNGIVYTKFTITGNQVPQIQIKANNTHKWIFYPETTQMTLKKYKDGTQTDKTVALTVSSTKNNTYKLLFFDGMIAASVLDENNTLIGHMEIANAEDFSYNNTVTGLGTNSGTACYSSYEARKIDDYINVIALGDSNTLGTGIAKNESYPALLNKMFWNESIYVINSGISGNHVIDLQNRLSTIIGNKTANATNYIFVQIGTNDIGAVGLSAETVYANLSILYINLTSAGFIVYAITVPPRTDGAYNNEINNLNTLIKKDPTIAGYIDIYSKIIDPTSEALVQSGYLQSDGLHLTVNTTNIIANEVYNVIKKGNNIYSDSIVTYLPLRIKSLTGVGNSNLCINASGVVYRNTTCA